ncbi:MAG: VIT and VWA domain-containing protein [Acidobacteriota bacterium]
MQIRSRAAVLPICLLLFLPCYFSVQLSQAQSGVLIPSSQEKPNDQILSLQVMNVDVKIDNQHAHVKVLQIFDNHVAQILEGKYLFALPREATIADFAVWDGDTRIPGVIMERRRANEIYAEIKAQQIDPGLLQQDDEHGGTSAFSAKVFPIPSYGTKRLELEYTEILSIEGLASHFGFPLKPSFGDPQQVAEFNLHIHIVSEYPLQPPEFRSKTYSMRTIKFSPNEYEFDFHAKNIALQEDLSLDYKIDIPTSLLSFIAYRAPEQISAYDLKDPTLAANNPDGYFEAKVIFNEEKTKAEPLPSQPRNLVLMLDTSLSMHGEKLVRAVEAVEYFLHNLTPQDQFHLLLFNEEVLALSQTPLPATPENVERALAFIKGSLLYSGTDIKKALLKGLELASTLPSDDRSIVLISDANATLGTTDLEKIIAVFNNTESIRLFAFGIGSDVNAALLQELTERCQGYFEQARETENISAKLKIFFDNVGKPGIEQLQFVATDKANFYQVYPTNLDHGFDGASCGFVGRYRKPQPQTTIGLQGQYGERRINFSRTVLLPDFDDTHAHLPRLWARARVDALLHEMDIHGEREDYIAEIIRLSQKYKFVTPYTAFIAAPRALLRPRLIQPGDPVIRVKTDASIKSIFVVLPFGETLPLKYLPVEDVWETRFFAPAWMPDGTYHCRLLLTDKTGNGYQEEKSFVIDSHPPKLKVQLPTQVVKAGDELLIRAAADRDTSRLIAKMYGAQPVELYWSQKEKINIGRLRIPAGLATGQYLLTVAAEDFAHNQSSVEIAIEVVGRL